MDGAQLLIPILVPLGAFAMIFGIFYLRTRENMAFLERGKDPRGPRPYQNLKNGLLVLGAGIGLLLAYLLDIFTIPERIEPAPLYFALIAIGGGVGLMISYRIEKREVYSRNIDSM